MKRIYVKVYLRYFIECWNFPFNYFFIFEVIRENCTASDFIFYIGIVISLKEGFDSLTYNVSYSYESVSCIKKFLDFLNLDNEIKMGNKKVLNKSIHELEFRNVSFAYPDSAKFALKNINLVLRLYGPTEVKILLDNMVCLLKLFNLFLRYF